MSDFRLISEVIVRRSDVAEMLSNLRRAGTAGFEAFALWAGHADRNRFLVRTNIIPRQVGHQLPTGVCVTIGPEELHRLNVWLYQNGMRLIAQIHTHPTDAFHSETDDAYPIATTIGCLSIVIPNFAREDFSLTNCAVYRLAPTIEWQELEQDEISKLIKIVE